MEETNVLLDVLYEFGENLGPLFLMPTPQMKPDKQDVIMRFLEQLPRDIKVYLELRHPEWYVDNRYLPLFEFCKNTDVGTVITDAAGRRDCVHMELTTPSAFIRFVGNSLHDTDYHRIRQWIEQIVAWRDNGVEDIFFFMHQHEELYSPELIKYMIEELNKLPGLAIPVPVFYTEAADSKLSLF